MGGLPMATTIRSPNMKQRKIDKEIDKERERERESHTHATTVHASISSERRLAGWGAAGQWSGGSVSHCCWGELL